MTPLPVPTALAGAAALFDLDGLLIDSEPLWQDAEIAVFGDLGLSLTRQDCASTMGWRIDAVVAHWHQLRGWSGPQPAEVVELIVAEVARLMRARGRALPGVVHALDLCRGAGMRLAVASSSRRVLIDAALDALGLTERFEHLQSAQDEPWGKPHPAVFLAAARALGVEPQRCVVLEDSPPGILAAKAANMGCIACPSAHVQDLRALALADAVLPTLGHLTTGALKGALRPPPCSVRATLAEDWSAVAALQEAAFGRPDEAQLTTALRADGASAGEWVAVAGGEVVGHILFTRLILAEQPEVRLVALAPAATAPAWQGRGVLDVLVRRALTALQLAGFDGVVVLGDPNTWGRFGFDAQAAASLRCPFAGPSLQGLALAHRQWLPQWSGTVRYAVPFLAAGSLG